MAISKTPDILLKGLGLRLTQCRKKKYGNDRGSLKECAEALNTSPQNWNDYESGRRELGFGKIVLFAEFFDVNPGWLLTGKGPQTPDGQFNVNSFIVLSVLRELSEFLNEVVKEAVSGQITMDEIGDILVVMKEAGRKRRKKQLTEIE